MDGVDRKQPARRLCEAFSAGDRNAEVLTFTEDPVKRIEVYFGWYPPGG